MKPFYSKTPRPEGAIPIRWGCAQGWRMEVAKRREAFTLIDLLVFVGCLAVLAVIVLPALARRNHSCMRINCVNNLKQIGLSYRTWALDNQDKYPMQVSVTNGGTMELVNSGPAFVHYLVMSNELSTPKILICPQDGDPNRTSATTFSQPLGPQSGSIPPQVPFTNDNYLSYFVGVDANQDLPNALLSGDRNLSVDRIPVTRGMQRVWTNSTVTWVKPAHDGKGNICMADGSVQQIKNSGFRAVLSHSGMSTNRLIIP